MKKLLQKIQVKANIFLNSLENNQPNVVYLKTFKKQFNNWAATKEEVLNLLLLHLSITFRLAAKFPEPFPTLHVAQ